MKSKLQSLKFDKVNQKQARNMMLFLAFFMFSLGSAFAQFGAGGSDNNNGDVRLVYVSGQQNSVEALKTLGTSNEIIVQSIKGAPQQLHSIRVKIQLPPGVLYTPSSFAITDNNNVTVQPLANVYVLAEDDISDLNAPIFSIFNNGIETELWDAGDYIQFTFERTAGCAAVTYKEDGNTFKDTAEISYVKTGFPGVQTATDTNALLANYDLLAASVSISNITAVNGTVGSFVHTREVTDFNGGNAGVQEVIHTVKLGSSVNVEPSVGAYSFSYLGNVISPSTTSTDGAGVTTNTYIINLSSNPNYSGGNPGFEDGNGFFDAGESLVFEESFTLKDCIDTGIQHQVEWTCQSSKITEGNVLFGANNPELDIDILENHRNISGVNHIRLKITNTASATAAAGFAKDILINVALGSNNQSGTTSYNNNPHWGTTRYNVRSFSNFSLGSETVQVPFTPEDWGSDNSSTSTTSTHALLPNTNINVDVDGVGGLQDIDGDNYYDDLAPGDSFVIEFDYEVLPRDNNCGTGRFDYMQWEHVFVDALTKDQCDSARPTEGVDLGYNNFIRDYNNATVFEQDTDIEELVPFEVALRPYLYSNFNHNDHAMINSNGDSEFTVSIEVPRGVDLVAGSPPEFSQTNGAYIVGLPGAGTNVISYTSTDILSGFTLREFSDFFARFPLVMNCTELELGGVTSVINISYETSLKLYDAPGGNLVFERDIHCGNFEPIIEHSCNPPCAGPNITGLDAYRITAGWSDNTMTSKVDLTSTNPDGSPVYELDKYLAGDEMVVETSGFMSSLSSDNLHFIQNYTTDGLTAGANDIEFVSGTIVITKFGGSTTLELPVSAPIVTSSGNTHTLDYDLSSALLDPIVGGLIEDQDTFEVNFKYKFTTDTYTNFGYHILSGFRGRYYVDETLTGSTSNVANDNDNDGIPNERLSCFDWGDQVAYLRPDNLSYGVANSTFEYCAEVWANLINDYTRSNSPHLHTGEYRPTTMIQSTEITIPDGAKILDVRQYNNEGYFYVSTGELDISPALGTPGVNTYTVTPNRAAGYRDQNQTSSVSYRMQVLVKGSCELKDASEGLPIPIITSTSIVQHMAYTETPLPEQLLTRTPSARLYYTKPTFIFQPLSSAIIVGFGPEADFDLRVVNNSSSTGDVGFNWIKIPANSNITIVGAEDITSSSIPLNIVQVGDDSYVEIGNLDAGETKDIRVSATYTSCTDVPVDFSLGWDCDAYPTNYGDVSSVCYDNTVQLTLQPAAGQVQQTITEPQPVGPFAMCDTIIYDVEYSSAQVATTINPESSLTLFNGASAVSITKIEAEYPAGSNNWEDLVSTISGGDTYVSPIIHSAMTPLYGGIPGTGAVGPSVNDRKVIVRYTLQTTCDFVSNSPLTFTVSGDVPCGEPTVGNGSKSVSNGIEIIGLDATYDALSTISLPDFANPDGGHIDGCSSQETINIFTTISELPSSPGASTGDFDYGRVVLPTGVTYVDGSFVNLGANVLTYVSSSPNELIVKYPSGLFDQDQTEFEFDIIPDAGYCEEDATVSYLAYIQNDTGASCGGTSCGGNLIATGTSSESLDIKKAAVVINLDSAIGSVTVLDELITAAFTIDNTSDVEVTAPATIGAYFDVNLDGVYDAGDLELGSHIITSAIPAGGSISESIQFTATPTQACNILLVMKVDENPCICVPASVSMGSPSVLTGIGGSNVPVCEAYAGSSVELGSPNNPDYTYVWTGLTATDDITYLDAPTTAQPNFVYGGPKLAATTTFTYQVEITRPGGCTSTDTVDVTVGYIEDPVISSSELEICSDEYLSVTFGNTLSDDEIIKIWKNAALTTPANLPNTSGIWTSTELYPAGTGNIYATVENTVTGCRTDAITIAYTITDCVADLVTTKSVSPTTASIGQDVVFTINVSNIGSSVDKNVTLSDVLPNNVAYVSDNSSGTYNRVTGLWTVGEIASGSSASLEITANINAEAAGGTVTNTTTAASGDYTDDTLIAGDVLDATVSVNSLVIAAANDNYSGVNGFEGNTNLGNILTGTGDDSLNGDPVTTADVAITYPTPATVNGNPITGTAPIISASGDVSVPAGTPAGTYSIPYTICEIGNSSNCSNATVTVVVEAPAIVATNDDYTASPVLSEDGNANLGNILGGTGDDTLNGVATDINEIDITLTSGMFFDGGSGPVPATGIVPEVDPLTGDVSVPAGTPAGRYTINYNICEELNPSNCSADAVVTIVVIEPPVANVDSNSGNTTTQPSTPINILSNDLLGDGITTATVLNTTVDLDPNTAGDQDVLVVPGEGTWNYNTSTGELVFTPETIVDGFTSNYTNDPTPIEYTLTETQTGLNDTATATVDYDAVSPTAEDDSSLANVGGAVTIDPLVTNGGLADSDPDGELDATTVSLVAPVGATSIVTDANGDITSFAVPNEGTWSVDETTGAITFTPLTTFTEDPTVISYNVEDNDGNQSNDATVTIDYLPVAEDNVSDGNTVGSPAVFNIVSDDTNGDTIVASTIDLDPSTPGTQETTLVVPNEGTWSVDASGVLTFTPEVGFTTDPTPITYTVEDAEGNTSNAANITVTYDEVPPVAEDNSVANQVTGSDAIIPNISGNDTLSDGSVVDTTPLTGNAVISLDPTDSDGDGDPLTLVVPNEGTWVYDPATDDLTFSPETGFTNDPTPIEYTLTETQTGLSDTATVTVDYDAVSPTAEDDSSLANVGGAVTIDPLVTNGGLADSDPDGELDATTVSLVAPVGATSIVTDANGDITSFAVPNEGTWSVDETTGAITFTPLTTFTEDPTVISYNVEDNDGNQSNDATVTIDYLPVAEDNVSDGNTVGSPAVFNIVSDDTNGDTIVASTIDLDPSTPGTQETTLVVPNEGTWSVDASGVLTFTPEVGFTTDPTPITYTVEDAEGNTSNAANITVTYDEVPPVAEDNSVANQVTGSDAIIPNISGNDTLSDGSVVDTTPLTGNAVISLDPTDSDGDGDPLTLVVPNEGTWVYDPATDDLTFSPETGFTNDPTPIEYTLTETQTGLNDTATATVDYDVVAPVAENDASLANVGGAVTIDPLVANGGLADSDPDGELDATTVSLVAPVGATSIVTDANGDITSFAVPNEGTWSVDETTGAITFTPLTTFTEDPTVISYNVEDNDGNQSNDATVTIDYLPVAEDNVSDGNTVGSPAVFNIVSDDTNGDTIVASTIDLDPSTPGTQETTLVVPNEGTWSVDTSGVLTFTPEVGFTTDPTPITYTVEDAEGNTSNAANITVTYDEVPPVAEDNSVANQVTGSDAIIPNISGNDTLSDGSVVDTTPLTGNAVISLDPTDSDGDGDPLTLVVPNEGTWVYDPATDDLTFSPETGFTNDPTPIEYTLTETQTGLSDTATVTVDYDAISPTAEDDSSLANVGGAVTIDPLVTNGGLADSDPDGELDATTVSLVAPVGATSIVTDANGDITSFAVPNEGTWSVDEITGAITFTPLTTFTEDPTVISYNVEDNDGNQSNDATVTIDYLPVAEDNVSDGNTVGSPAVFNIVSDDTNGDTIVASTIDLDPSTPGTQETTLVVPNEGTWSVDASGVLTFTPEVGFTTDPTPITYTVEDAEGNTSNAANITVTYDEVPPVAEDNSVANQVTGSDAIIPNISGNDTLSDGSVVDTTPVTGNAVIAIDPTDADGDGNPLTLVVPNEGTWTYDPVADTLTFTPETGFTNDPTPIEYILTETQTGLSDTATVTVDYDAVSPTAEDDSSLANVGGAVTIDPLVTNGGLADSDPDGELDATTVSLVAPVGATSIVTDANGDITSFAVPNEGTWSVDETTGAITFTPLTTFTEDPTVISYNVEDNDGNQSNDATVTIDYLPVAEDNVSDGNTVGSPAVFNIVSDDTNGDTIVASTIDLDPSTPGTQETTLVVPNEGTWSVDASGVLTFTPEVGFTTDPTPITYTVEDAEGNTSNAANITVTYDEVPPVAEDNSVANQVTGSDAIIPNISGNDTLSDGSVVDTTPLTGNAVISLDPTDSDGDGDPLTLVVPNEGTWVYDPATDDLTFSPETGFTNDPTPIEYTLTETQTGLSDTATVTVDYDVVAPVAENDASLANVGGAVTIDPLVANGGLADSDPDGELDATTVSLVAPVGATSIVTDANGDITSFAVPNEGTWSVDETTGAITFTPLTTFTEDPTVISYNVEDNDGNQSNDATVTITYIVVTTDAINDLNNTFKDVAVNGNVITNDIDAEGDIQTVSDYSPLSTEGGTIVMSPNGDYVYTPAEGFTGTDTFIYTICDDGFPQACDTATVTIKVLADPNTGVNEVIANSDTATTEAGSSVDVVVLANDIDPEGDALSITPGSVTDPVNGTIVENADGTITYTPDAGFVGEDTFTYEVCDTGSPQACDTATVTVTVDPSNGIDNDTYANDDAYNGNPNMDIAGSVLDNDTDPEGDTPTVNTIPVTGVENGTLVLNPDGTFVYTPNPDFSGTDSFVYEVCDNGVPQACDQATVYITVNPNVYPMIELLKTAVVDKGTDGRVNEGDIITYTFTVENTGDVTVSNITVSDVMLGVSNLAIISGTLEPTETGTIEFDYAITAADILAGRIENTATANGTDPYGDSVSDISDDPNDTNTTDIEGDGEADGPTVTLLRSPYLELTKDGVYADADGDNVVEVGEIITYTFTVRNTGNIDVTGLTVDDAKLGVTGLSVSPADLTPGSTGTVTYEYALTQADLDAGVVYNVATANGTTSEGPVSDESEDPTPVGPSHPAYDPTCPDCTVTLLTSPQIELRKTATIDIGRDGVVEEGDTITYTFTVVNTGNAVIEGITVTDTMLGVIDAPIVSPLLFPGQVGVYTFDYKITDADIAAGRIENTATANGIDPYGNPVTDISDDPNDTDTTDVEGDGEPDGPTVTVLPIPMADIVTVKDDGEATYIAGTDVVYTITVTNNGPSDAANVIVSDPLPVGVIDATWVGDNGTSGTGALTDTIDLFLDGDSITYTVTLSVPFEFTGDLINVVTVTSDTMDPNPTCADCIDVNALEPASDIGVTKEASVESALVNDEVTFTITAQNFGPQNGTNIVIEDVLPSGYEYISHLTTSGVYDEASGLWSIDALEYNGVELLEITVKVLNATDYTNVATVLSVDQVDLYDANDSDEVTLGVVLSTTCIEVYSTFTPHNVDGINDYFTIDCIENYPKNTLKIYNRWGYEVYTASGYNNTWDGVSNGPRTVNEEDKVPVGTYYYVLDLGQGDEPRIGWLYIN